MSQSGSSSTSTTTPALPATRVVMAAAPVLATLQAAKEALDKSDSPEAVQSVRANLDVLRAVLLASIHDPNAKAEDVAEARRQLEALALEATLKLGAMVPIEGAHGARTDLGSTSTTVVEVARRTGVPDSTLRRYRELAAAYKARTSDFMVMATNAINAGLAIPMAKLIELVKPKAAKPDKPGASNPPNPPSSSNKINVNNIVPSRPKVDTPAQRDVDSKTGKVVGDIQALKEKADPFADDDPIRFIGGTCAKILAHLTAAKTLFDEMAPEPLDGVGQGHARRECARDAQLQKWAEFFESDVPEALQTGRNIASLDRDGVLHKRAERDKTNKKARAR